MLTNIFCVAKFLRLLVGTYERAHIHKLALNVHSWLWPCWRAVNLSQVA